MTLKEIPAPTGWKKIKYQFKEILRFKEYIKYAVKSELKAGLASTHLGYLWWILDPLMYMMIYILVVEVILNKGRENFPIFVFCAVLSWKWTSGTLIDATSAIKSKTRLLQQIYIPKFILVIIKVVVNTAEFLFGIGVLIILILMSDIRITPHIFEFTFVFVVNFLLIMGISLLLAHIGVFFKDIKNILGFSLRLWFYVSPGIYSIQDVPEKIRWMWKLNPLTVIYQGYRNCFLYGKSPDYFQLLIWFLVILAMNLGGIMYLIKYDKKYIKVG